MSLPRSARDNLKVILCSVLLTTFIGTLRPVNCNDALTVANKLVDVDFQSSIEHLNVMRVNRPSDVRIRSVLSDAITTSDAQQERSEPIVSEAIINRILEATENISSAKCRDDMQVAVKGIQNDQRWALKMYDASVKEPTGIESGDSYQFGNFDECLSAFQHHRDLSERPEDLLDNQPKTAALHSFAGPAFNPQYCLAQVTVQGYSIAALSTRDHEFKNRNSTRIFWGLCIPDSCPSDDVANFLASATGHKVSVEDALCTRETREAALTSWEIIFMSIMGGFFSIVVFCTAYNAYLSKRRNNIKCHRSTMEEMVGAFSLTENLKKLISVGSDDLGLRCVNGIKAVAMLFIVAGHSLLFMIGGPVKNSEFFEKQAKLVQNALFLNSPLLVDTFLLLSGFLLARLLMLELEKRKGRINFGLLYIFRYIRLTPAYLAVIALYSTILPRLGSGPLWNYRIGLEKERCVASWWANLLYINNYVGTDKMCMFQSWYLSADTQLFILAPLLLYPLWRCRRAGIGFLGLVTVATALIPFIVTYVKKIDPTFLVFADEITDLQTNDYFVNVYIKTHMRATAYVFGLLTGYLVHVMQEKNTILSRGTQALLWVTSVVAGVGSMFSVTIFYYPEYKYSTVESALYAGLHRFGWSYFTGWLVLACVTGYAGGLRSFFSSRALIPFSRLTYCAYLTNGLVELYNASTIRSPKYLSIMNLTVESLGHAALTFLAALVLCLMFESPIHGIEKVLLRRDSQRRKTEEDRQLNNTPSTSEESGSIG